MYPKKVLQVTFLMFVLVCAFIYLVPNEQPLLVKTQKINDSTVVETWRNFEGYEWSIIKNSK